MNELLIERFVHLIAIHTGLSFRDRDREALAKKIWKRIKACKLSTPEEYYQLLVLGTTETQLPHNWRENQCLTEAEPIGQRSYRQKEIGRREWKQLMPLVTTGESYFFRDKGQFWLLRNAILPSIIQQQKQRWYEQGGEKPSLRIWSAGCSTGEEPYSLAIMVTELIPNLEAWDISIVGTDINQELVQKAQTGVYSSWSFRTIEAGQKEAYFQESKGEWRLNEEIRSLVKFHQGNLVADTFPNSALDISNMNLILCRNVFVYFDAPSIALVLEKFYHTLKPGGYMITAHAELHGQDLGMFRPLIFSQSVIYQKPDLKSTGGVPIQPNLADSQPESPLLGTLEAMQRRSMASADLRFSSPNQPNGVGRPSAASPNITGAPVPPDKNFSRMFAPAPNLPQLPPSLPPNYAGSKPHTGAENSSSLTDEVSVTENGKNISYSSFMEMGQSLPFPSQIKHIERNSKNAFSPRDGGKETNNVEQIFQRAEKLFHNKIYPEAIGAAEKVLEIYSNHLGAHYLLAQIYANLGNYQKADDYCHRLIGIDYSFLGSYYLLAKISEETGEMEKAKYYLKRIIYLVPISINAYLEMAQIYEKEADFTKAEKMRLNAVEILRSLPDSFLVIDDGRVQITAAQMLEYIQPGKK
ncbi:MAG TPA: tetratricopeptide repeat protein [Oscillatoriaceae cyanobacterium M33_DOE_052]|nr:tetratricopeptide repeat protein [Oscillatoriaceae cyanobacterium M33_DOE_052]